MNQTTLERLLRASKRITLTTAVICLSLTTVLGQNHATENSAPKNAGPAPAAPVEQFRYGPPQEILTDEGPISFGMILSIEVVSWSAPDAMDLLVSRCWDGVYLYPSKDLKKIERPIKLCGTLGLPGHGGRMFALCTTGEFSDQPTTVVIGNRNGSLYLLRKIGKYPDLRLKMVGPLEDPTSKRPINIPFTNPNYQVDTAGGYLNLDYFNYVYPIFYPDRKGGPPGLIAGDWGGNLWWLPRQDQGQARPGFAGVDYEKSDGKQFAKPELRAVDENGRPLLLGFTVERDRRAEGGVTRPAYYRNERTGSDDLLVLSGTGPNELYYLKRVSNKSNGSPSFANLGRVTLTGGESDEYDPFAYHARVAVFHRDGWNHLLLTQGSNVAVYYNEKRDSDRPAFRFSHWLAGRDVPLRGWNYTEILRSHDGKRYLLENDNQWYFREVIVRGKEFRVSSKSHPLLDQTGVFRADAETDPHHTDKWGFHRAALWDFDGSGKQHLVVGSDGGHLYLLRQDKPLGIHDNFVFTSIGPLKDSSGQTIRIHNRVAVAPVDLDRDGRLDLVLAGASYQLGVHSDPNPGAGIYFSLNQGVDRHGAPVLTPPKPLEFIGYKPEAGTNEHYQLQTLYLTGPNERLVVIASQRDKFRGRVYRVASRPMALEFTGMTVPKLSIEERILDLNGDGKWEYVKSGSESLIGSYAPVLTDRDSIDE